MDKSQARQIIKETFENPFDKNRFNSFIKNLLNRIDESQFSYQGQIIPDSFKPYINKLERVGKYSDGENKIDILIIKLQRETSLERARTMQRNFVAWYLNGSRGGELKDAALVAFVSPDQSDWRFSLVKMDYKFEETKSGKTKVKEEFTPARRWSFLVGVNEKSHTAQSRLVNIVADDEHNPALVQLEEAFNIETVTKEFFFEYRNLFIRTKEALDKIIKNDPKLKAEFEAKDVDSVNFSKKLLGQIVFLYFLQKKGWFGVERDAKWGEGSKRFLRELFEKKHNVYNNFFNEILEPLFYEALRVGEDRKHLDYYYSRFDCRIPFLNGGLFDPIGDYDWVHTDIILPNELFSNNKRTSAGDTGDGILDIFDRFNFTVAEDEPLEKEVAIDPELLGKAYEKFNAIRPDNFDEYKKALKSGKKGDETKFNKQYGVFYTPREIVHFMCQQSLINYLSAELDGRVSKRTIEFLILEGEKFVEYLRTAKEKKEKNEDYAGKYKENKQFFELKNNASKIDRLLAKLKMCDPAVGSGAFPVGMMTEIVKARMFFVLTNCLEDEYINSHGEKVKRNPYNFKRDCIENSLYGVDIDPGAVEIAKLRLWLSLVVDEDDITNIKPLPNLDYKIVCGNSLLGVEKNIFNNEYFEQLEKLKPLYFNETNPTKKQEYKKQIDELILKISNGHKDFDFEVYFSEVFHDTKIEKDWKVFHITWATHNSRRNENIAESKTEGINPILLSLEDRNRIAEILSKRIIEKEYRVLALNVLDDHVHLLLVCEKDEVSSIVGNLKGYSSYEFHKDSRTDSSDHTHDSNHTDVTRTRNHTVNRMVAGVDATISDTSIDDRMVAQTDADTDADTSRSAESTPTYSDGTIRKLWAAKFSNTYMKSKEHFASTIEYIQNNHLKHTVDRMALPSIDFTIVQPSLTPIEKAFSPIIKKGGFDVVIANPPYITIGLGKKQKFFSEKEVTTLKNLFADVFEYKGNTFTLFLSKAIRLLNTRGVLTYIIPNTLLLNSTFEKARKYILNNSDVNILLNFKDSIFEGAETGGNLVIVLDKHKEDNRKTKVLELRNLEHFAERTNYNFIEQKLFKKNDGCRFNIESTDNTLINKITSNTIPLGNIVKFYQGIITGDNDKFIVKKKSQALHEPILRGRDINKYYYSFDNNFVLFDPQKLWSNTNEKMFRVKEKIINRQTGSQLIGAYDNKGYFSLDSTHVQILIDQNYNLKYILALFNSKLLNYYYNNKVNESGRVFAQIKIVTLKTLPIKTATASEQAPLITLVDRILAARRTNPQADTIEWEREIDQMIYQLYGLTGEEIRIVEGEK